MVGLQVLITNHTLGHRAGSELYVRDLATSLLARGHHPIAYSPRLGKVAEELRRATIPVINDLRVLSKPPDIIHGHHHLPTMTALLHFPDTPAIAYCHGWLPEEEAPARSPRIYKYIAVDHPCRDRLIYEHGIAEERIRVLLNFVDLQRFTPRPPLAVRPKKALVFSNQAGENTYLQVVRKACDRAGLSLDVLGLQSGNVSEQPELELQKYDLVFAKARAAMEAIASGTAVILCDAVGAGPMVTSENFDQLRPLNFGIRTIQNPLNAEYLLQQIEAYNADDAAKVTTIIRTTADRETVVDELIQLYEEAIAAYQSGSRINRTDEMRQIAEYLQWLSPRVHLDTDNETLKVETIKQILDEIRTIKTEAPPVETNQLDFYHWLRKTLHR